MSEQPTPKACRKSKVSSQACSVTIPKQLQEAVIRVSLREDRSFSATVRRALERYLAANP